MDKELKIIYSVWISGVFVIILLPFIIANPGSWPTYLNDGLIGYWPFNSSSGTTAYDSVGNFDGVLLNMEDGDWVAGKIGNALSFDGSNENVNVTSSGWLDNLGTGSLTYCFWLKTTLKDNGGYSFTKRTTSVYPLYAATGRATTGYMAVGLAGVDIYQSPPDVTDNVWHSICVVRDTVADKLIMYIDGNHIENKTDPTTADISNSVSLMIGGTPMQGQYYTGLLDEVGIWNRSLNTTEISDLWNGGIGITYEAPVVDTCTCPGAGNDWEIDHSDGCNITDACDLTTGTLSFTGAGSTFCNASIDTTNLGDPGASGILYIQENCIITID